MLPNRPSPILGNRYDIGMILGEGGMGAVYRATDRLTDKPVAVKRLLSIAEQLQFALKSNDIDPQLSLANEFQLLASLRHPNIIGVLDYGFDRQQPYYVMELIPDAQTIIEAGYDQGFSFKANLLIQTLQALVYLHRRGILHRDLKPSNILVSAGQVKVLDFGISMSVESMYQAQMILGTLEYMAPELFKDEPATEMTDLYAVGVLIYELLTGFHPFKASSVHDLINNILLGVPDLSLLRASPNLAQFVSRLLAQEPAARFHSASETISAFCTATNQPGPVETVEIRESYLQAAAFVGRQREREQLRKALKEAVGGKGSIWFITGESGVGKSRLVDDLRIHALVSGVAVLRSACSPDGDHSYQVWQGPLRRLILSTEITDFEAGVLNAIIPDIPMLLGRDIPDIQRQSPDAQRKQLFETIVDLFCRHHSPILLILEDLHWATESLALLSALHQHIAEIPLLLVGSFRDDELMTWAEALSIGETIRLPRFEAHEVAQVVASMLGNHEGNLKLVDLLNRETEGNALFVVETVRALAIEAGDLSHIYSMQLPEKVFAGGINQILQRKLERVTEASKDLLKLAAIGGRDLDLPLLQTVLQLDNSQFDLWLVMCANAYVLEVQDQHWRFTHDKLRDVLLQAISADEQISLHRAIAQGIEKLYPGDQSYDSACAIHWHAGNMPDKELPYVMTLGQRAFAIGSFTESATWFERARVLVANNKDQLGPITAMLARVQFMQGNEQQAQHLYEDSLKMAEEVDDLLTIADVCVELGMIAFRRNEFTVARDLFERSLICYQSQHHRLGEELALNHLGGIYIELGDAEKALDYYNQAMNFGGK